MSWVIDRHWSQWKSQLWRKWEVSIKWNREEHRRPERHCHCVKWPPLMWMSGCPCVGSVHTVHERQSDVWSIDECLWPKFVEVVWEFHRTLRHCFLFLPLKGSIGRPLAATEPSGMSVSDVNLFYGHFSEVSLLCALFETPTWFELYQWLQNVWRVL